MMAAWLCAGLAVMLTSIGVIHLRPLLVLLNTPPDLVTQAASYLRYLLGGGTITIAYNLLSAILRALGNSRAPLCAMVLSSIVNVTLDIALVTVFHLGISGIAVATLIAQLCACGYCIWTLQGITWLYPRRGEWRVDWSTVRTLHRLAMPLAFRNLITGLSGLAIQYVINGYGLLFVAGMTAAKRFYGLMEIGAAAIEAAVATYVAQNYGAERLDRIRIGMAVAVRLCLISSGVIAVMVLLFGKHLLALLVAGDKEQLETILNVGYAHLAAMGVALPALYLLLVWRAALQGMGNTLIPMVSGFVELVLRLGAVFFLLRFISTRDPVGREACASGRRANDRLLQSLQVQIVISSSLVISRAETTAEGTFRSHDINIGRINRLTKQTKLKEDIDCCGRVLVMRQIESAIREQVGKSRVERPRCKLELSLRETQ